MNYVTIAELLAKITAEELVGEELVEWYSLSPIQRWLQSAALWERRCWQPLKAGLNSFDPTGLEVEFSKHLFTEMATARPVHPDFHSLLLLKERDLIELFLDLRSYILEIYPDSNETLYHTHALTAVFSVSEKLSDAFCLVPIYSKHLNLGFNKGTLLQDPHQLLTGTGNLMRHIGVKTSGDYRNPEVKALLFEAIEFALNDMDAPTTSAGKTISKIKKS